MKALLPTKALKSLSAVYTYVSGSLVQFNHACVQRMSINMYKNEILVCTANNAKLTTVPIYVYREYLSLLHWSYYQLMLLWLEVQPTSVSRMLV